MRGEQLVKRTTIVIGILVILAGAGAAWRAERGGTTKHEPVASAGGRLGVDEFMRSPDSHQGRVRVEGVVSTVEAKSRLVTLIDRSEWDKCGEVNCAPLSLPVHWTGAMPRIEDGVAVTGHVEEQAGKLVFIAETVELVPLTQAVAP